MYKKKFKYCGQKSERKFMEINEHNIKVGCATSFLHHQMKRLVVKH